MTHTTPPAPVELQRSLSRMLADATPAISPLPLCPSIQLWLLAGEALERPLSAEEQLSIQEYPCYWAFCWASGHRLACYLLDNPELVANRTVIDVGCGSGVVAIAAALAGARTVVGCDLDPDALAATRANAELNGVDIQLLDDFFSWQVPSEAGREPLIIAADLLYDRSNLALVEAFLQRSSQVLIADSRIRDFAHPDFMAAVTYPSSNQPESSGYDEFHNVNIYASKALG